MKKFRRAVDTIPNETESFFSQRAIFLIFNNIYAYWKALRCIFYGTASIEPVYPWNCPI